jgi:hypothetical protein
MRLSVTVEPQPTDDSCGITCLQAIYRYFGKEVNLSSMKRQVVHWQSGGTVGVNLARHALENGFGAEIYTYNIKVFDPTWRNLPVEGLIAKLEKRLSRIRSKTQQEVIGFYLEFLRAGGKVRFDDLDESLIERLVAAKRPIICGLSATYLYQSMRETPDCEDNDIIGGPVGHFVVVSGYDAKERSVHINDPLHTRNPFSPNGRYVQPFRRFSNAVMLGILTYDANLLVLSRPTSTRS